MKIEIQGNGIELTEALKEYVRMRIGSLQRLLQSYELSGERCVFVELSRQTGHKKGEGVFYAEAMVELPLKKVVRAERTGSDLHAVIDKVKDVMKMELTKYKELQGEESVRSSRGVRLKN